MTKQLDIGERKLNLIRSLLLTPSFCRASALLNTLRRSHSLLILLPTRIQPRPVFSLDGFLPSMSSDRLKSRRYPGDQRRSETPVEKTPDSKIYEVHMDNDLKHIYLRTRSSVLLTKSGESYSIRTVTSLGIPPQTRTRSEVRSTQRNAGNNSTSEYSFPRYTDYIQLPRTSQAQVPSPRQSQQFNTSRPPYADNRYVQPRPKSMAYNYSIG